MTTTQVSSIEICAKKAGHTMTKLLTLTLAMLACSLFGGNLFAANAIRDIAYSTAADGTTEIALTFAEAPAAPAAFATEAPPRIALDFADTRNELTERRVSIGAGATAAVSAVEAGGKTRVVIELYRKAGYSIRNDGNRMLVSVADTAQMGAQTMAPTTGQSALTHAAATVTNVDFRRGPNGEGRVLISFNKDNIGTDLRKEGNKIIVDIFDVSVAETLPRRLDVTDFATPVNAIETNERAGGVRLEIATVGNVDHMAYQTGTDYVVEITEVKKEEDERRKLGQPPEYTGTPLTFNFQDIPVRSVLQLIADVSQLNIVVADSVQGSVTTRLENVPWDQALDIVLQAKGLDKRRQGGVIWVAPTEEIAAREQALEDARIAIEDRQPLISEYIAINYGNAKDIATLLTENAKKSATGGAAGGGGGAGGANKGSQQPGGFLSQRGSVTFDQRTNTLLVNDIRPKIDEIKELIALLDRPVDQVLIESRVVIATQSFARDLGARFGVSGAVEDSNGNLTGVSGTSAGSDTIINQALANRLAGRGNFPVGLPSDPTLGEGVLTPSLGDRLNVNLPVTNPAGSIGLAVLGASYILDLELSALESEGNGEVISNPRVITANQREALIRQGREIGYTATTIQNGVATTTVLFKPVALELKATPTITQDDRIFLAVDVAKDELDGFVDGGLSGQVPVISTRRVTTAVLVEDGQTVVLGGVYEFSSREDLSKVPFLADIPGVGNFFKRRSRDNTKAELLIFVTPKILRQRGKS